MTKLKPCPFCGGTPATVVDDASESLFGVKCFRCGGSVEAEKQTLAEAVAAWNRRSGESWACIDGVVQKVGHVTLFAPQEVEKDKGQEGER